MSVTYFMDGPCNTGSHPWCGGAYLAWHPPIYASFTTLSLLVQQAAVKWVFCPRRFGGLICPLSGNAEQFLFSCSSNNLERASLRSVAPPKLCMCSVSP